MDALFSKEVLTALFFVSIGSLIVTVIALPAVLVRLPEDYFARDRVIPEDRRHLVWRITSLVVKNVLGAAFLVGGFAMLFFPGQGLLTILIGLVLVDFPGKRRFEQAIVRRRHIASGINRLRRRFGHAPLRLDDGPHPAPQ